MQPSLEARHFRGSEMSEEGEAGAATVFEYHEDGDLICGTRAAPSGSASSSVRATVTGSTSATAN
jgi:hypothetical protein